MGKHDSGKSSTQPQKGGGGRHAGTNKDAPAIGGGRGGTPQTTPGGKGGGKGK